MAAETPVLSEKVATVLAENKVMSLATAGEGAPWCFTCFFAEEGFDLLFLVEYGSTTYENIRKNPRVAFSINLQVPDRFVQGVGTVEIIGDATEHGEEFAPLRQKVPETEGFVQNIPRMQLARVITERIGVTDMETGIFPRQTLSRRGQEWLPAAALPQLVGAKAWFIATRPWSFPASLVPMLVGAALGYAKGSFDVGLLFLTLAGGLLFHVGANLFNTYFDYRRGVDTAKDADDRTLVDNLLPPSRVAWAAAVCFGLGAGAGAALAAISGWPIVVLGAIGLFLAFFYTAGPFGYKYRSLGDVGIFVSFGPLLVLGAYLVQRQDFAFTPLLFSLPVGLFIDAILHANNMRDTEADARAGARTLAHALGPAGSSWALYAMLLSPYLFALAFAGWFSPWTLLPLLTAHLALQLVAQVRASLPEVSALLPQKIAQLSSLYGLLLAVGVAMSRLV